MGEQRQAEKKEEEEDEKEKNKKTRDRQEKNKKTREDEKKKQTKQEENSNARFWIEAAGGKIETARREIKEAHKQALVNIQSSVGWKNHDIFKKANDLLVQATKNTENAMKCQDVSEIEKNIKLLEQSIKDHKELEHIQKEWSGEKIPDEIIDMDVETFLMKKKETQEFNKDQKLSAGRSIEVGSFLKYEKELDDLKEKHGGSQAIQDLELGTYVAHKWDPEIGKKDLAEFFKEKEKKKKEAKLAAEKEAKEKKEAEKVAADK